MENQRLLPGSRVNRSQSMQQVPVSSVYSLPGCTALIQRGQRVFGINLQAQPISPEAARASSLHAQAAEQHLQATQVWAKGVDASVAAIAEAEKVRLAALKTVRSGLKAVDGAGAAAVITAANAQAENQALFGKTDAELRVIQAQSQITSDTQARSLEEQLLTLTRGGSLDMAQITAQGKLERRYLVSDAKNGAVEHAANLRDKRMIAADSRRQRMQAVTAQRSLMGFMTGVR